MRGQSQTPQKSAGHSWARQGPLLAGIKLGYVSRMEGPPKPTRARFALAANLKELMARHDKGFGFGMTAPELEQGIMTYLGAKLSAKTINRVLDPYSDNSPNLETIDLLAEFFRIPSSELLSPRPAKVAGREDQTPVSPAAQQKKKVRIRKS